MNETLAVPYQVPEFVRADYPVFVDFLKSYYAWLEAESGPKLEKVIDIDNTVDGYLKYFKKTLDLYGVTRNTDEKFLVRNIRQLYQAKGSDQSFKFFFRILFNKDSSIINPWEFVFKPSAGRWQQDVSIVVIATDEELDKLSGANIVLVDRDGNTYRSTITNILRKRDNYAELFIKRGLFPRTIERIGVESNGLTLRVAKTTISSDIEAQGAGFRAGQVFIAESPTRQNTIFKIKTVNANGGITAIDIITFGNGYETDFNLQITAAQAIDPSQLGAYIQLGNLRYPSSDTGRPAESGYLVGHDYTLVSQVSDNNFFRDMTYVGDTKGEIINAPTANGLANFANIRFRVGGLRVYTGYYSSSENILGDETYIQDSFYYQAFSYVTQVEETLDKYGDLLKKLLHPSGTKHFARYAINTLIQLEASITPALNINSIGDGLSDIVVMLDKIIFFITKGFADESITNDEILTQASYIRSLDNEIFALDEYHIDMQKSLSELVTLTEAIVKIIEMGDFEDTSIADSLIYLNTDKYLEDQLELIGSGGLYMEPYYAEPLPFYWEAGYLENERAITD